NNVRSFFSKQLNPPERGDFRLGLKVPYVNFISLHPGREFRDSKLGFIGLGLGFEYNYRKNKFLEAGASFATTSPLPFPAPFDAEYYRYLSGAYFGVTDNFICNRFSFGYGVNYTITFWSEWIRSFDIPAIVDLFNRNHNLGLTLNSFYRLGRTLNVASITYPQYLISMKIRGSFLNTS
ncbi:MAG TPA: hypothetical protein VIK74_07680, partial [Parasegetibacter sp.]